MTESVIADAPLQAMHHYQACTDSAVWRYKLLFGMLAATFLIKYRGLLGLDLDC